MTTLTDEETKTDPFAMFEIRVRLTSRDGEKYDLTIPDFCSDALVKLIDGQVEAMSLRQRPPKDRTEFAVMALRRFVQDHNYDDGFGMGKELATSQEVRWALEPLRHTEEREAS